MRVALSIFVSIFLFSALVYAQKSAKVIRLNQEFTLKVNERAHLAPEGLQLVLESVPEDSRCPEGVNCIWAGNAKVKLTISKRKQKPTTIELNTTVDPKNAAYLNYEIKLVALKPYPKENDPIKQSDFHATVIVTKK